MLRDTQHATIGVFTPVTAQLWIARLQRDVNATEPARPRAGPVAPAPLAVRYPFSTDAVLRELYVNPFGGVRVGRLLEDLDSLAGSVALSHVDAEGEGTRPPLLVTASVDAIRLRRPLRLADGDLMAVGQVVHTGSTSMDIRIELGTPVDDTLDTTTRPRVRDPALTAVFTFACRDPDTGARLRVPALDSASLTPREAALSAERAAVAADRRATRAAAASAAPPPPPPAVAAEAARLLAATTSANDLPALAPRDAVRGGATAAQNTFTCQPQQRNISGRIFGGFLMRRAFELAYAGAFTYAGFRPALVDVEEVSFLTPIEVGDLLRLRSRVLHASPGPPGTHAGELIVAVEAHVVRPESASTALSNTFIFRFGVALAGGGGRAGAPGLKCVLPESEADALAAAEYVVSAGDRWDGRVGALVV